MEARIYGKARGRSMRGWPLRTFDLEAPGAKHGGQAAGPDEMAHADHHDRHAGAPLVSEHEKALWCYADALEAYRKGRWAEALGLFRQALTLWPQDGPSRALAARCEVFQATPPPDPWDGVFEQLTK